MNLTEFLIQEKISDTPIIFPPKSDPLYPQFAEREHNARTIRLGNHLISSGEFDRAYLFLEYETRGIKGEVDLLAEKGNTQAWFEIKYKFTPSNLEKAVNQFKKYTDAFPKFKGRAYYVSCDGIVIEISNKKVLEQFD